MSVFSGQEANRAGAAMKNMVRAALRSNHIAHKERFNIGMLSVLDKPIRVDFYVPEARQFTDGLYIECRWQDSGGSAQDKICYLRENIQTTYDRPTVVVIDGKASQAQYDYLKRHADPSRLVGVLKIAELMPFARQLSVGSGLEHLRDVLNPDQKVMFNT